MVMATTKVSSQKTSSRKKTSSDKKKPVKKAVKAKPSLKKLPLSNTASAESSVISPNTDQATISTYDSSRKLSFNRTIFVPIIVIIIFALLYTFRSSIFVATVNNQPIWAGDFYNEIKRDAGKQAMSDLVTKTLILQEAQRKHIAITDADVSKQIKTYSDQFSTQGQTIDQFLKSQNMTMSDLRDRVHLQLTLQKLLGNSIQVSDKEINDYLEKNKDSLPNGEITASARAYAKQQLQTQKLQTKFQELVDKLQKQAKINYYISY